MASRQLKKPRGRRVTADGRSEPDKKYVQWNRWMYATAAFASLDPFEVRLLFELYALYNGFNNGRLYLSLRQAALRCKMSKDKAGSSFHTLQERGFIRSRADEPSNFVLREARCWILTEHEFAGRAATKEFMNWRPDSGTRRAKNRTRQTKPDKSGILLSQNPDENVVIFRKAVPDSGHR
jgi:hypothetical protein